LEVILKLPGHTIGQIKLMKKSMISRVDG